MELQWKSTPCNCMKRSIQQVINQEQTLEVRLSDGMPDIGRVLCAWGQTVLRGKEWRNDGISVTGGVSAWVLYLPEDGSAPQSVQAWLPFQGKWNFSEQHREGVILADCLLRGVDARTLSARKLMVRVNIGIQAEILEQTKVDIFTPEELPQQVYALEKTYPVSVWTESGEKILSLEETFSTDAVTLLSCRVRPVLTERNVVGSRVVVRGTVYADTVCLDGNGKVFGRTLELPFAQLADLEGEYDKDSAVQIVLAVSNLEPELTPAGLRIKCGLVVQYAVRENKLIRIVEDVYSPSRKLTVKTQTLTIPTVLDECRQWLETEGSLTVPMTNAVDVTYLPEHPIACREGEHTVLDVPGSMQLMWYDPEGMLCAETEMVSGQVSIPASEHTRLTGHITQETGANATQQGNGVKLTGQLRLDILTASTLQVTMVTALEVGEQLSRPEDRPSLLLQRVGEESLWDLAKASGSTVEAIREANGLEDEPLPGVFLLIPVL